MFSIFSINKDQTALSSQKLNSTVGQVQKHNPVKTLAASQLLPSSIKMVQQMQPASSKLLSFMFRYTV